jgi:sialic acid synthase SpsE
VQEQTSSKGYGMQTKLILEIGYNHNGDEDLAMRMIEEAAKLGAWGVKFQKWNYEGFPEDVKSIKRDPINSYGKTYYEHRKAVEFDIDTLYELEEFAETCGLEFVCSGKDYASIQALLKMRCKNIKVPSQRFLDKEILELLSKTEARVMVSAGMHSDIDIQFSPWWGVADVMMHCVSLYPAPLAECNIDYMRRTGFNGYSSHEIEGRAIKYAVICGADWIERHYTFDKQSKGSDHKISSDFAEIKRIQSEIEEAEEIRGSSVRIVSNEEKKVYEFYGRF